MATLWQDVRYGVRMLCKNPGFTATALITLAIGIGANTVMFSAVNALLLRPMNVKGPEQLVGCYEGLVGYREYVDVRDDNPVFSDLTGYTDEPISLKYGDYAGRTTAFFVPANYFSTLGVAPMLGRGFLAGEDRLGAGNSAVLTYHQWERYGADPDILGQEILVNGWPCQVVGVMPKHFTGVSLAGPAVWLPWGLYYQIQSETHWMKRLGDRHPLQSRYPGIWMIGRLKPGLTMAAAQEHLAPVMARAQIGSRFPLYRTGRLYCAHKDDRVMLVRYSAFLLGASVLILLVGCLNLANMYLVQGASRQRELAVRAALGGSRWRLTRQLLAESLLLAVLGSLGGLLLAFCSMRILDSSLVLPRMLRAMNLSLAVGFDLRVLGATLAFTTIAALLSDLWPAVRLSQRRVAADLKEVGGGLFRSAGRSRRILPRGLSVVGQVALSVVVVMTASLFTHSALKAAYMTPGYRLDDKLLIGLDFGGTRYSGAERQQLCRRLIERVSVLPGVQRVGLSNQVPFDDGQRWNYIAPFGQEDLYDDVRRLMRRGIGTKQQAIGGDYLQTVGLPLLRGRYFTPEDSTTGAPVVIVSEPLARRLQPGGDVLGRRIGASQEEVIGIVPDVRHDLLTKGSGHCLYQPLGSDIDLVYLTVCLADSARTVESDLLRTIPKEIRAMDPQIPVLSATRLAEHHRKSTRMWMVRMLARLSIACGITALFLAALGIYGVKSYVVAARTPEIGIRMTLGATNRGIVAMVLREGAIATLAGLSLGMWGALVVARLVRSVLCEVHPIDAVSIVSTVVLLAGVSLLAGYLPARRAARIDPMVALRYE